MLHLKALVYLCSQLSFLGLGDIVTIEAFDWTFSYPNIITSSSVIGRLMDDMESHKVCDQKILSSLTS